eukprot:scaffold1948_cov62-Phaeocystis_antarctica.AAC.6
MVILGRYHGCELLNEEPGSPYQLGSSTLAIRSMHIKRCNSLGEMIGPVAPPWASVLCRLGV